MTISATIGTGDPPLRPAVRPGRRGAVAAAATALFERCGAFEIRLAAGPDEIRQAQRLRFLTFFGEGGAIADDVVARLARDLCPFDEVCDHLIVVDTDASAAVAATDARDAYARDAAAPARGRIVGTYRLLRREIAERRGGFYSESEFDLAPLLTRHPTLRFLELGRSCVHPDYRSKRVIELLWRGLWLYTQRHAIDALIGCASLPGIDVEANRLALSFVHHHALAEPQWQVAPLAPHAVAFEPLDKGGVDLRRGLLSLPPLIKAYLRAGARFSSGAVVDHRFRTIDLFTVMPMAEVEERHLAHYGRPSCLSEAPTA